MKWGRYHLPIPKKRHGILLQSSATCFVCLLQFIVAPELIRILAFNQKGQPWHCKGIPNDIGYLKITHCADTTLFNVWYLSADSQESLLRDYTAQQQRLQRPLLPITIFSDRAFAEKLKQTAADVRTALDARR
jgi:hypothetical protein